MKEKTIEYTRYNLWANERIISMFRPCKPALLEKEIISSFPSVRKTIFHIIGAEEIWRTRLQEVSAPFPTDHAEWSIENIFDRLIGSSNDFSEFVKTQTGDFFKRRIYFKTAYAGETSNLAYDMIHHCVNHSTYHRGQLVTMARQIGMEKIPPLDQIFYIRELEKAKTW